MSDISAEAREAVENEIFGKFYDVTYRMGTHVQHLLNAIEQRHKEEVENLKANLLDLDSIRSQLRERDAEVERLRQEAARCPNPLCGWVPQTYGEAQIQGWIKASDCEGHDWDNRTTAENAKWMLERLFAKNDRLTREVERMQKLQDQGERVNLPDRVPVSITNEELERYVPISTIAAELLAARARIAELEADRERTLEVLSNLYDEQNGPPLIKHEKSWQAAMDAASAILDAARAARKEQA